MPRGGWAEVIYPAAELFVERSLRSNGSFVTGAESVWTPESVDEFYDRFVVKEDLGSESFTQKLSGQLAGASENTILLAADLVCLCTVPVHDMGPDAKLNRIRAVTGLLSPEPEIDDRVLDAFTTGIASYGAGKTAVWKHMRYLAEFARIWATLDSDGRAKSLGDAWAWKDLLASVPGGIGAPAAAMLHMVFPDVFEPIVSVDVKASIGRTFSGVSGVSDEPDADRKLTFVRAALAPVLGDTFQFWDTSVQTVWQSKPDDRGWTFAEFARKFRELSTFDEQETDYKLELAARLASAREAVLAADENWLERLKRAFGPPNNITSWRQHDSFLKWCEANRDAALEALKVLWLPPSAGDTNLEAFLSMVPDAAVSTPGARANVVSYLLGARAAEDWVNYKATGSDRALTLAGLETAETGDVVARIRAFSSFIDQLRVRVVAIGGPPTSRLEAQGMTWFVVGDSSPEEWSEDERRALQEFRGLAIPTTPHGLATSAIPAHAWLVRGANVGGENLVDEWLTSGFVSISFSEVPEVATGTPQAEIFELVKTACPDDPPGRWRSTSGNLHRFLNRIEVGDLVVTFDGDRVYVGRVTGPAIWDPSEPHRLRRRTVEWLNPTAPASRSDLVRPASFRVVMPMTVVDLWDPEGIAALVGLAAPKPEPTLSFPEPSDELAKELHVPQAWLGEIVDLLRTKGQLIFYGPPGTGKTYVAKALAKHLVSEGGALQIVQFHPSYSYEDFFEGYRPDTATDGGVSYELKAGPLKRLADAAYEDPTRPYILIVDEINRGNIPKIFGELLFLLEYRDEAVELQYGEEQFSLPANLFVIGTMNTADRSIALVDAALRRRFFFVPFLPTEPPVNGVLRSWLQEGGHNELPALLLDELNRRIAKDEVAIGPSYFMGGDPSSHASLRRVWRHAILPLLDEHYYGTKVEVHKELSLEACLSTVRAATDGNAPPEGAPDESAEVPDA